MYRVARSIDGLFFKRPLIVDVLAKDNSIVCPDRGFRTVHEVQFNDLDNYVVTWAWLEGGMYNEIRYTLAVAVKDGIKKVGWVRGHKDYVFIRPIPNKLLSAAKFATSKSLELIDLVPGFGPSGKHVDRWFSHGLFAVEDDDVPECLGDKVRAWRIKEGMYITFPDGSYRLMRVEDYENVKWWDDPEYRQGDLFVWQIANPNTCDGNILSEYLLEQHHIACNNVIKVLQDNLGVLIEGPAIIKHFEYETLELPNGIFEIRLLPGTSKPFVGGGEFD